MSKNHELVLPNKDLPFKMFLFEGKEGNYRREKHWHSSVEIFAVFEGELEFFIEDRKTILGPGKCMIVNSNELHAIYAPRPNSTVVVQIPLHFFEPYFTDEQFICFSHGEDGKDTEIMEMIREMYLLYEEKGTGHELQVISRFYALAYRMVTKYRINMQGSITNLICRVSGWNMRAGTWMIRIWSLEKLSRNMDSLTGGHLRRRLRRSMGAFRVFIKRQKSAVDWLSFGWLERPPFCYDKGKVTICDEGKDLITGGKRR